MSHHDLAVPEMFRVHLYRSKIIPGYHYVEITFFSLECITYPICLPFTLIVPYTLYYVTRQVGLYVPIVHLYGEDNTLKALLHYVLFHARFALYLAFSPSATQRNPTQPNATQRNPTQPNASKMQVKASVI